MKWRETQDAFAAALKDPARAVPDAVGPRGPGAPVARFNVYRNNTAVSLREAMCDSYPVVEALVGSEFFAAMARAYIERHPPTSPVLLHYGGDFADFIADFGPAQSLPFLSDVARIEWAWVQAYHASDLASVGTEALGSIGPDKLAATRLKLHPSLTLIQSRWPAISIWSAHQLDDPEARAAALGELAQTGEHGVIVRPDFEVNVQLVQPPVWQFLSALRDGATLGTATEVLEPGDAGHLGGMLGYIFSIGAVAAIQ